MQFDKKCWPATINGRWIEDGDTPGLVSVIVPTYNREKYILETLDSVYAQTYRPIELIVVDDGSTDSSQDIVETWIDQHRSEGFDAKYILQENQGAPVARNRGTLESSGEFIQYLDSDDTLDKHKIENQARLLIEDNSLDLVNGSTFKMDKPNEPTFYLNKDFSSEESLQFCITGECGAFCTPTALFARKLIARTGPWDDALKCLQDVDYGGRVFSCNPSMKYCVESKSYLRSSEEERNQISFAFSKKKHDDRYFKSRSRQLLTLYKLSNDQYSGEPWFNKSFSAAILSFLLSAPVREETNSLFAVLDKIRRRSSAGRLTLLLALSCRCMGTKVGIGTVKCLVWSYRKFVLPAKKLFFGKSSNSTLFGILVILRIL